MTSRRCRFVPLTLSTVVLLSIAEPVGAVSFGMVDDFQAGTVAGWSGAPTSNVANAGPAGAGDNALNVAAASGRVAIVNTAQWTGNYSAAGVTKILADVRHQNAFSLQLRLGMASGLVGSGGAGDTYVSANAIPVANDGLWHRVAFEVSGSAFVPHTANSNPSPSAGAALASVSHFRILHNPVANFLGANGPATFFLDNIRAVPEPSCNALAGLSAVFALAVGGRRWK